MTTTPARGIDWAILSGIVWTHQQMEIAPLCQVICAEIDIHSVIGIQYGQYTIQMCNILHIKA
ncbi:hypothetical protein ACWCPQ_34885 [Nocardia sp. NPDC001965]